MPLEDWGLDTNGSLFADAEQQQKAESAAQDAERVATIGGFTEEMQKRGARALFEDDLRRSFGPKRESDKDHTVWGEVERVWARVDKYYMKAAGICLTAALGDQNE